MLPPVGSSSPSTSLAVVVLPQPDSPTTPSVCPLSIANEMSSTARTTPRLPPKIPRLAWKCLLRPGRLEHRHHAAPRCALALASQQRAVLPSARLNSGGVSLWQRSNAAGQRGANAQPRGSADRSGGWPSIAVSRFRLSLMRGIEFSSASV